MAKKKSNSFMTFLLILFTIFMAFFLGCGVYLMFVPNAQIFGIAYASNTETQVILKHNVQGVGDPSKLSFKEYSKVIVTTTNNAKVNVNCGVNYQDSIILKQASRGFYKVNDEAKNAYKLNVFQEENETEGKKLYVSLVEPEYTFAQITNNTVLELNINPQLDDDDNNLTASFNDLTLDITTINGNVTIGGATSITARSCNLTLPSLKITSEKGGITIKKACNVTGKIDLKTKTGFIDIQREQLTASSILLNAQNDKIITNDLGTTDSDSNIKITSSQSKIVLGNIIGNLTLDTRSGSVQIEKIEGSFICHDNLLYTYIKVKEIDGNVYINRPDSAVTVNLGKISGNATIILGKNSINIKELNGGAHLETSSGAINFTKTATNSSKVYASSKSGTINATFDNLKGDNDLKTISGDIHVKYNSESSFCLNASSDNIVICEWNNENKKTISKSIGTPDTSDTLDAVSQNGKILLSRVS